MFQVLDFIKTIVLTFVFVFLLQMKIGEETLEQRAHQFIQTSLVLEPLRETTGSAVTFLRLQGRKISRMFSTKVSQQWSASQIPGQRHLGLTFKRSQSFLQEQADKRRQKEAANQEQSQSSDELNY